MSVGGKGGSTKPAGYTTSTTTSAPWTTQQQYLETGFNAAKNLFAPGMAPEYYKDSTYSPVTSWQDVGLGEYNRTGYELSPYAKDALQYNDAIVRGSYLNTNPALTPLEGLWKTNLGEKYGLSELTNLAQGAPPLTVQELESMGRSNAAYLNPAYNDLLYTAQNNPARDQGGWSSLLNMSSPNYTPYSGNAGGLIGSVTGSNLGRNNPAYSALSGIVNQGPNQLLTTGLGGTAQDWQGGAISGANAVNAANNYGAGTLRNIATGQDGGGGAQTYLEDLIASPYNATKLPGNTGASILSDLAGGEALAGGTTGKYAQDYVTSALRDTSPIRGKPGGNSLVALAEGSDLAGGTTGKFAQDYLTSLLREPSLIEGKPGIQTLTDIAAGTGDSQASDYLTRALASPNVVNDTGNVGAKTLQDFAKGTKLSPYLQDLADATEAAVLPSIQSQFIRGGGLSNPQAAYASSQGVAAALAPVLDKAYQNQQQVQLDAAGTLSDEFARSRESMTGVAQGREALQADTAYDLANQFFAARGQTTGVAQDTLGLQQQSASDVLSQYYGARGQTAGLAQDTLGLQQTSASDLANQYQQSRELTTGAAQGLLGEERLSASDYANLYQDSRDLSATVAQQAQENQLAARGTQTTAGGTLWDMLYGGQGQQLTAADLQGRRQLDQAALQQDAATTMGSQYLQGTGYGLDAGTTLGSQLLSGQDLEQRALTDSLASRLGWGNLQYNSALGMGQNTIAGGALQEDILGTLGTTYGMGIDQQMQAIGLYPSVAESQFLGPQGQYTAGSQLQLLNQQELDADIARWNYGETLPFEQLNTYLGQIGGNYGYSSATTNPYYLNSTANLTSGVLGGGLLGAGLGNAVGGYGGIGAALGAGLGLFSR